MSDSSRFFSVFHIDIRTPGGKVHRIVKLSKLHIPGKQFLTSEPKAVGTRKKSVLGGGYQETRKETERMKDVKREYEEQAPGAYT